MVVTEVLLAILVIGGLSSNELASRYITQYQEVTLGEFWFHNKNFAAP